MMCYSTSARCTNGWRRIVFFIRLPCYRCIYSHRNRRHRRHYTCENLHESPKRQWPSAHSQQTFTSLGGGLNAAVAAAAAAAVFTPRLLASFRAFLSASRSAHFRTASSVACVRPGRPGDASTRADQLRRFTKGASHSATVGSPAADELPASLQQALSRGRQMATWDFRRPGFFWPLHAVCNDLNGGKADSAESQEA